MIREIILPFLRLYAANIYDTHPDRQARKARKVLERTFRKFLIELVGETGFEPAAPTPPV